MTTLLTEILLHRPVAGTASPLLVMRDNPAAAPWAYGNLLGNSRHATRQRISTL